VAVLPEAEEVDVRSNPKDLRIDTFLFFQTGDNQLTLLLACASPPADQRGVPCRRKSQIKNAKNDARVARAACKSLRNRSNMRRSPANVARMVGSGDRSERNPHL